MSTGSEAKLVNISFIEKEQQHLFADKQTWKQHSLKQGLLIRTIERGVKYPVIHIGPSHYYTKWNSDGHITGSSDVINQGHYEELAAVHVDLFGTALTNIKQLTSNPTWRKFYIVLGFKQLPFQAFTETTEVHWKDWTLARYFFLNMPDDFGLSGLTFYKRHNPNDFGLFLYMVVVECAHILPRDQLKLNDFVNRIRADKMPAYMALYESLEDDREEAVASPLLTSTPIKVSSYAVPEVRVVVESPPRRERSPSPVRRPTSTQSRGTSPLGQPWFFMSHPQFLRRNQRHLQRSGDLDSVGESEERSSPSLSFSTEELSTSPTRSVTPLPYYYRWSHQQVCEY